MFASCLTIVPLIQINFITNGSMDLDNNRINTKIVAFSKTTKLQLNEEKKITNIYKLTVSCTHDYY